MRYVITLAAIPLPLLLWTVWPTAPPPVTVKVIATEGVTARRLDDTTFSSRWRPVLVLPAGGVWRATANAHVSAADETLAGGSSRDSTTARQPSRRIVRRASLRSDVCIRHGMVKVMVGKYRWRCRR